MIVPVTPHIFVPHTTQKIPQASTYQIVPTLQSIPQIPIGQPIFGTTQTPFQGQAYQVPPFQGQVFQILPYQGQTF